MGPHAAELNLKLFGRCFASVTHGDPLAVIVYKTFHEDIHSAYTCIQAFDVHCKSTCHK